MGFLVGQDIELYPFFVSGDAGGSSAGQNITYFTAARAEDALRI